jgi:hypothetical protein
MNNATVRAVVKRFIRSGDPEVLVLKGARLEWRNANSARSLHVTCRMRVPRGAWPIQPDFG